VVESGWYWVCKVDALEFFVVDALGKLFVYILIQGVCDKGVSFKVWLG
jgi:hypothetical protein